MSLKPDEQIVHQQESPVNEKNYIGPSAPIPSVYSRKEQLVYIRIAGIIASMTNRNVLSCKLTPADIAAILNINEQTAKKGIRLLEKEYNFITYKDNKKIKLVGEWALLRQRNHLTPEYMTYHLDLVVPKIPAEKALVFAYLDSFEKHREALMNKPSRKERAHLIRNISQYTGVDVRKVRGLVKRYKPIAARKKDIDSIRSDMSSYFSSNNSDLDEKKFSNSALSSEQSSHIVRFGVGLTFGPVAPFVSEVNAREMKYIFLNLNSEEYRLAPVLVRPAGPAGLSWSELTDNTQVDKTSSKGDKTMKRKKINLDQHFNTPDLSNTPAGNTTPDKSTTSPDPKNTPDKNNLTPDSNSKAPAKRVREGTQANKLRRQGKKSFLPSSAKKEVKIPKVSDFQQNVINLWNEAGLKKHTLINTQGKVNKYYRESLIYLKLLLTGGFSDMVEEPFKEFFSRRYSEKEVLNIFQTFAEAYKNPNAEPSPDSRLYEICRKTLTIKDFIYSTGKWTGNGPTSLFKQFAEEGIKTPEHKEEDKFPDGTLKLMTLYTKEFKSGIGKLTYADEYRFRLASNRLFDLYHTDYSDRILWESKTQTKAQILELCYIHHKAVVEAIETMRSSNISVQPNPGWYCSKKGLHDRLPKYLTEHALLSDNYRSLDPNVKKVVGKKWSPDFKPHADYAPKKKKMPFSIYN